MNVAKNLHNKAKKKRVILEILRKTGGVRV